MPFSENVNRAQVTFVLRNKFGPILSLLSVKYYLRTYELNLFNMLLLIVSAISSSSEP